MSEEKDKCLGIFGSVFGHAYEPRYSYGTVDVAGFTYKGSQLFELVEAMKPMIYVRDVCVRCGKVVK